MNEWMNQWRDEWKKQSKWMNGGGGKAAVLCGIHLAPPIFICPSFLSPSRLIGWEDSMLLEGTAVMWGLPPSLPTTTSAVYEWKLEKLNEEMGCMWANCVCSPSLVLNWEYLSCFGYLHVFYMHTVHLWEYSVFYYNFVCDIEKKKIACFVVSVVL